MYYLLSSLNGTIEMDGFKSTFSELYSDNQLSGLPLNRTYSDDHVCSSGNGASSDIMIVRHTIHSTKYYRPNVIPCSYMGYHSNYYNTLDESCDVVHS